MVKLVSAYTVRKMFGGVSDMTLWRWLKDPDVGFPKPIRIARRRYWRLAELEAFIDRKEQETRNAG